MPIDLPQAPKGGLAGFAERTLKTALLEARLRPGQRLVTRELASSLGMSPTPVREALLKLVAAGALEAMPAQAFLVPRISAERYQEIAHIRLAVEGLASETAVQHIDTDQIAVLRATNEAFRRAKRRADAATALRYNKAFRFRLYESAEMPVLLEIIERLWLQIGPSLAYLYPQPKPRRIDRHNYDVLLEALDRRDSQGVRMAISQAIESGTQLLLENMRRNPNCASPSLGVALLPP